MLGVRDAKDIPIESFLEALPSALLILDIDLRVVTANEAFYSLFQLQHGLYEKHSIDEIEILRPFHGRFENIIRNGETVDLEFEQDLPTGRKVLVLRARLIVKDSQHLPMVSVVFDDITQRKRTEERFRQLVEAAPDAMVIVDTQSHIVLCNAQTQKLFGYTSDELLGQPIGMLLPPRFQNRHRAHQQLYFDNPRTRLMGGGKVLFGTRKDGSEFPLEISLSPLNTEEGVLVSAAIRDITERRAVEALEAALEREKKLNELKSHFVSMISHEIRTPMTGIQTSTELIQLHGDRMTEKRKHEHLNRIQENVKHLTYLVDDILTLSKAQSVGLEFVPTNLDVEVFCRKIAKAMQPGGEEPRIQLTLEQPLFPRLYADPKLLSQALNNLLANALKYAPAPSHVQFTVSCTSTKAVFQIADSGIGIPPDDQQRLFQVFQRGSNVGTIRGTGLGLAIVKQAVDAHRGEITLHSEVGRGSTFTLTIPQQPAKSRDAHAN